MYINLPQAIEVFTDYVVDNKENSSPRSLYEPRNYIMDMKGKKMRALLTILGYGLYKDDWHSVLDLALCAELFHNFTLVHDDIMDEAETRRNQPSVHVAYGVNSAILSGDLMLIEVYDRLARVDDGFQYIKIYNKMAREVYEGQALDMDFETRTNVTIAEYLKMIEFKTAVLLGMSLQVGALAGGASAHEANHLYQFGVNAGIAFQLQDDYLDVYGDPDKFGKKVGGDIIQGKKTYLYLRAMELMDQEEKSEFHRLYTNGGMDDRDKVKAVTEQFDALYLKNYCREAQESFLQLAYSHLAEVRDAPQDRLADLKDFIGSLIDREQ